MSENSGLRTYTASGAIGANIRVKLTSPSTTLPVQVEVAGLGEQHIGITEFAVASGDPVAVRLRTYPGTQEVVAADTFAHAAVLYGAAAGKVTDNSAGAGNAIGQAMEACTTAGDIIEMVPYNVLSDTAANIEIVDADTHTDAANVEAALAEIYQGLLTAQGFIPVPLATVRELTTGTHSDVAGNGGLLASDTTPILGAANGDTDGAWRVAWAGGNSDAIGFQVPLPPDLNDAADVVIHFRAAMAGTDDIPVISADSYFNEGDTKVEDDSGAVTGATYAEYTITIAHGDVPAGAQTLSVELTPAAHATNALYLTAIWIEYTRKILTA
jgi:hypothetical protein